MLHLGQEATLGRILAIPYMLSTQDIFGHLFEYKSVFTRQHALVSFFFFGFSPCFARSRGPILEGLDPFSGTRDAGTYASATDTGHEELRAALVAWDPIPFYILRSNLISIWCLHKDIWIVKEALQQSGWLNIRETLGKRLVKFLVGNASDVVLMIRESYKSTTLKEEETEKELRVVHMEYGEEL